VPRDHKELQALKDHRELLEIPDHRDHKVLLERKALLAQAEQMDMLGRMALRG
jgi:hypothetical protein